MMFESCLEGELQSASICRAEKGRKLACPPGFNVLMTELKLFIVAEADEYL